MHTVAVLVVALGVCMSAPLCAAQSDTSFKADKEFAVVSMFYEVGTRDYEYALGTRVALQSFKSVGSAADRVVLVHRDISPEFKQLFEQDGLKLFYVDKIKTPYGNTPKRFAGVMIKLAAWRMTQYQRVVVVDADVIAIKQPDILFSCGEFCAVYLNPVNFHTGIIVVKPSEGTYKALVEALPRMGSFDAADQGFLNTYYKNLIDAPFFHNASSGKGQAMNRLPVQYSMNHVYFYERFTWGGAFGGKDGILCLTYPITQVFKPWNWWGYPTLVVNYEWSYFREQIDPVSNYQVYQFALFTSPLVVMALRHVLKKQTAAAATVATPHLSNRGVAVFVLVGHALWFTVYYVVISFIPGIVYYWIAWPLFGVYHTICLWFVASLVTLHAPPSVPRVRLDARDIAMLVAPWLVYYAVMAAEVYHHFVFKILALATCVMGGLVTFSILYYRLATRGSKSHAVVSEKKDTIES